MKRRVFLLSVLAFTVAGTQVRAATPALKPVVKGLDYPWGMAFLPDGSVLVTERVGALRRVNIADAQLSGAIAGTPEVASSGQGGLLGIAIDPAFAENRRVYMSFAERRDGGSATAVFRAVLSADHSRLEQGKVIFRQNPVVESGRHFGSRLVFDGTGHLFVTTGDRGSMSDSAQDSKSHIGKVLRITTEGAPAPGNPPPGGWLREIWSMGHRNIQGAALNPATGELWTVEHGARGGDELNKPQSGKNYGWPVITYGKDYSGAAIGEGQSKDGLEQPVHFWDPSVAPSGLAFVSTDTYPGWKGSVLVGALAGAHISRLTLSDGKVAGEEKLFEGFARFRDVVEGPDGRIYVLTDDAAPEGGLYVIA